jgi:AcrR family transcriptional regulator
MAATIHPSQSRGTVRLKGEDRREAILTAAASLYVDHGPAAVSTRMIAEAVGISQPSLYAHFPTKQAITHALSTRAFGVMEARLQARELEQPPPGILRLEQAIRTYIDFALAEPVAYRIAFMLEEADPPAPELVRSMPGYAVYIMFASEVAAMQAEGLLRDTRSDVLAQSIWAGMHGLCSLLLARSTFPWAERSMLIDAHVALLVDGAARPGQKKCRADERAA